MALSRGSDARPIEKPRRLIGAAAALAAACGAAWGLASPAAHGADPPAGRAYEMVSPPAKANGGVVFGHRAADDGNAAAFQLNAATGSDDGAFALTPYVARRTPNGWVSRSAAPPIRAEHRGTSEISVWTADFLDDFSKAIILTNDNVDPADHEPIISGNLGSGFDFYLFDPIGRQASWISRPVPAQAGEYAPGSHSTEYVGRSRDGSHLFFTSDMRLVPEAPVVEPSLAVTYEWADGQVRLVGILPDGTPYPGWTRAATPPRFIAQPRGSQAISQDGSRIFWTPVGDIRGDPIYLREDGVRTLVVSASRRAGSVGEVAPGTFLGATRDGATVYFHSPSQLTDDAPGGGLYRWQRAGEQLTFLAEADGLDDMTFYRPVFSEENERLYFTTSGRGLAGAPDGGRNLYLWDGRLRWVAPISAETFLYADARLRATPDGRYVAFTTTQSLDPRHAEGTVAIYRYDAETGAVACASCRTDGQPTAGPAEFSPSDSRYSGLGNPRNVASRNVTTDGRVYFQTPDPLVAHDTNAAVDVYEFGDGGPTLISSGEGAGSEMVDNSDDGGSVFFVTAESLLSRDVDGGFPDVYVARVGGGFPEEPRADATRCDGDACQGTPTPPPLLPPPASELVEPVTTDDERRARAGVRIVRPSARQLRTFAVRGRIRLGVAVTGPGRLSATARARIGRRQRTVAATTVTVSRAGRPTIGLRLSRAARRQLAARGALRVRVSVRHSAVRGARSVTLVLREPRSTRTARRAGATTTDRAGER